MFNDNHEPCSTLTYLDYRIIAHNYAPWRTSLLPLIHATMWYQKLQFQYVNGMSVHVILNILSTSRNVTENILSYRLFPTAEALNIAWNMGLPTEASCRRLLSLFLVGLLELWTCFVHRRSTSPFPTPGIKCHDWHLKFTLNIWTLHGRLGFQQLVEDCVCAFLAISLLEFWPKK